MIALIQLVQQAKIIVNNQTIASINNGLVTFIGIHKNDNEKNVRKLLHKILHFRIFPDKEGKMNVNLLDIEGDLLLVPQFTLIATTEKGTRPGFSEGMAPKLSKQLFTYLIQHAKEQYHHVEVGQFGAHMEVHLCNNGPITFILKV